MIDWCGEETLACLNWSEIGVSPETVRRWWIRHQKADDERRAREAKAAKDAEDRDRAELARLKAKYEGGEG